MSAQGSSSKQRPWRITVLISGSGSNFQALLDALPTTLENGCITSVISNSKDAYGLKRAASHSPPIPSTSYSPFNYQKANPNLFNSDEQEIKQLAERINSLEASNSTDELKSVKSEWSQKKKELAARVRPSYQLELAKRIKQTLPDLIVLAGFMLILLPETLESLTRDWEEDQACNGTRSNDTTPSLPTPGRTPYPSPLAIGTPIPIINLHPALPNSFVGPHVIEDAWEAFNQRALPNSLNHPPNTTAAGGSSPFGPKIDKTGIMIHRVIPELDRGEPVLSREVGMIEGEDLDSLKERIHKVEHEAIVAAVKRVTEMLADASWWK